MQNKFTLTDCIEEELSVGHKHLSALLATLARVTLSTALINSTTDLITEMKDFFTTHSHLTGGIEGPKDLFIVADNIRRRCGADFRVANFLQDRIKSSSTLLAQTLSFRDQEIAKEQNDNMLQLNKSAVFITMLSLVYAPASFVAVCILPRDCFATAKTNLYGQNSPFLA